MIGDKQSVFIIAEAGVNHNGDLEIAKDLIEKAAKAGADAVKFQTFIPEKLVSRYAQKAEYQKVTTGQQDTQLEMLRKLQLKREYYEILKAEAEKRNISLDDLVNEVLKEELKKYEKKIWKEDLINLTIDKAMEDISENKVKYFIYDDKELQKPVAVLMSIDEYKFLIEEINKEN